MAGSDSTMVDSCSNSNVTVEQTVNESVNQPADEPINPNDDWQTLYEAGKASLKSGSIDRAIGQLTLCLEKARAECDDELSLSLAPLYYEYGSALLANYQSTSSALGDTITNDPSKKSVGADQGGLLGELGDDETDDLELAIQQSLGQPVNDQSANDQSISESNNPASAEDADDLELAFDMFEMARVIYQKSCSFLDQSTNQSINQSTNHHAIYQSISYMSSDEWARAVLLSRVHEKLAQVEQEMEKFDQSYSDSFAALLILQSINQSIEQSKNSSSSNGQSNNQSINQSIKQSNLYRDFAGIHMDLATCSLHQSKVEVGLHHFIQANLSVYQSINQYFQQIGQLTQHLATSSVIQQTNPTSSFVSLEVDTRELNAASIVINQSINQWASVEKLYALIKECEELVSELNERITDLRMEVERANQSINQSSTNQTQQQSINQSINQSTTIGFHNQPFDIPKLSFVVPSPINQSINQSIPDAVPLTNQPVVRRRVAPITNVDDEQKEEKRRKL